MFVEIIIFISTPPIALSSQWSNERRGLGMKMKRMALGLPPA
jgi:hypothetical protein